MKSIKEIFIFETDEEDELAALIAAQDSDIKAGSKVKDTEKNRLKKADAIPSSNPTLSKEPEKTINPNDVKSSNVKSADAEQQNKKKVEPKDDNWFNALPTATKNDKFKIDVDVNAISGISDNDKEIIKSSEEKINSFLKHRLYSDAAKIINTIRTEDPEAHKAIMQAVIKIPTHLQAPLMSALKGKASGGVGKKGNPWGRYGKKGSEARLDAAFNDDEKETEPEETDAQRKTRLDKIFKTRA